jgi:hypothetical protein
VYPTTPQVSQMRAGTSLMTTISFPTLAINRACLHTSCRSNGSNHGLRNSSVSPHYGI